MSLRTRATSAMASKPADAIETKAARDTARPDLEKSAVDEAMRLIQRHVDKEARHRWVDHLDVRDLCPRQKADLVADLARLF